MLVLGRKVNEMLVIGLPDGREVVVSVVEVKRESGMVRLGIVAPADVRVDRFEVAWTHKQEAAHAG